MGKLGIEGATQDVYSRGPDNLAMSSGEAEMTIVLRTDSTAAIGMLQKRGTGRARH